MTSVRREKEKLLASIAEDFSLPLTEAQEEILLAARMNPVALQACSNTFLIHLRGDFKRYTLLQCLQKLVDRHDALRTSFDLSEPKQHVAAAVTIEMPMVDLTQRTQLEQESELVTAVQSESNQAFDLTKAPLLRAWLAKLSESHHVLLLTSNHLVADTWSVGILLDELKVLYANCVQGMSARLAPAVQFREYVQLLDEPTQRESMLAREAYWLQQFADKPAPADLPNDFPRPAMRTYPADQERRWLGPDFCQMIRTASTRQGCTPQTYLLAVFKLLVSRLTGQEDLVVAIPAAGLQQGNGNGALVGNCVNFLPVRSYCRADLTFTDYLKTLERIVLDAYRHQNFTRGSSLTKMSLLGDPSRAALVPVVFNVNRAATGFSLYGLETEIQEVPRRATLFDLELNIIDFDKDLGIACTFNSDLFAPRTIQRWLSHYQTLLADVLANPDKRLWGLALLSTEEQRQILVEWNGTEREYPRDRDLPVLFETQVERTPEAMALEFEGESLTYSELNRRANQLAHWLKKMGVGPDVLVGLYMGRSLETMVALLGVLKAGGAYVPLDTAYPQDRLAFMLADANPKVVITQERLRNRIPDQKWSTICLDSESEFVSVQSSENPRHENVPKSLAYVIYTSGSTGRPKGVAMTRQALVNLIIWQCGVSNSRESSRTLQFTSLNFDVSFQEIFSTWCSGGSLVLIQEQVRRDSLALLHFLQENRINRLFLPFIALEHMAEAASSSKVLPSILKEVYTAGEQLIITPKILGLFEKLPECSLHNHYGPSESHVVTAYTLPALKSQWQPRPPIGCPIENCQVYILDDHLRPVPVGVAGELFIGGSCLARGYFDRPELTAERFVPNPFVQGRLYKTGDLVRYLHDGNIEFLGRSDHQVKLRGFRIELGEIESVLVQHPGVGEAVVVVREDVPGDQRLVAYIVRHGGHACEVGELRSSLSKKVPDYMLPSAYVFLDALPLTPSGKVDRRGLPAVSGAETGASKKYVGPRDEIERKLTKIWEELLGVGRIGIRDSFFDLGGHSLLAIRLIARVEQELRKTFSIASLFQSPTIEGLAQELRKKKREAELPLLVPFRTGGTKPPLFLHGGSFELSRHLGEDQPCYGLEPHGQDGRRAPETVEEMAADYLRQIRSVQPQGPYVIGGYSFGGLVAYEMAQQLRQSGQKVGLLVLVDSTPPHRSNVANLKHSLHEFPSKPGSAFHRHLGRLRQLDLKGQARYFLAGLKSRGEHLIKVLKMLVCCACLEIGRRVPSGLRMFYFFETSEKAAEKYMPSSYDGPVVLLESQSSADGSQSVWRELISGDLKIHELPGNHLDPIMGTQVEVWGNRLKESLLQAGISRPPSSIDFAILLMANLTSSWAPSP